MNQKFALIIIILGSIFFVDSSAQDGPKEINRNYDVDGTVNWKIYRNSKYNYQFKYPGEEWQFGQFPTLERTPSETADEIVLTRVVTVKSDQNSSYSFYHMRFTVSIYPNPNNLGLKEWYYFPQWANEKFYNKNAPYFTFGLPVNKLEEKDLEDLKRKAQTVSYPAGTKEIAFHGSPALETTIDKMEGGITFAKSSFMFSVDWYIVDTDDPKSPAAQLFKKILSTFQFINRI